MKRPGFDQIAQGMGGLMWITGLPGQGPVRAGIPVADLTAGMYGAIGVLVALLEREVSGEGQWVHTSLLQSMISMLDFQAARYTMAGEVPPQAGNDHPTSIPTGVFKTADGYINIAAAGDVMWDRLCEALNDEALASNPDFATGDKRSENREAVNAAIEAHTVAKTSAEWIDIFNETGIPTGPIYKMDEVFADEQVGHLKMRHPVRHSKYGDLDLVANAVRMSRYEARTGMATPERGQHTDEVLGEFGFSEDEIQRLRGDEVV